jgi:hypothetical protein
MEIEEIRVRDRLKIRGLKNRGIVEILENPKTGDFVVIMGQSIRREWGIFNLPEGMWRAKCSREEVSDVVKDFLVKKVLAG